MKKKKLVTLAAVTAMAASMLAGCGSPDTGSTSSSAEGQEEGKSYTGQSGSVWRRIPENV